MTQFRPMRFLHAAGLMLERPLLETGELAGDLAKTAAHATLFAWERLVDLAIAKDVDSSSSLARPSTSVRPHSLPKWPFVREPNA